MENKLTVQEQLVKEMGRYEYTYLKHEKDRELILNTDIDENVLEMYTMKVIEWNKEDLEKPVVERRPIKLFVNSCGGEIMSGFNFIDIIKNSVTPVYAIVMGYSYSMGMLITLACHKRYAFEHSTLLIHDGSRGYVDSGAKARDMALFYDELDKRVKKFVLKHTKMTDEQYDDNYRKELYTYADKAKELGFVDFIIGEDISLEELLKM